MTRLLETTELPADRPDGFAETLAARAASVVRIEVDPPKTYVWADAPGQRLWAWYSRDPRDEARVSYEAAVREAIGTDGPLRAPPLLARGPLWRVEERIESEPVRGEAAMAAIVLAMADLARRPLPFRSGTFVRESPLAAICRRSSLVRSPLPLRDLVRARRALEDIDLPLVASHGELFAHHILLRDGVPWIVDWETCEPKPAGYDLMHLWTDLHDARDRDQIYTATVQMVGEPHERDVALLRYSLTVRMIAAKVGDANNHNRDDEGLARLLHLLPEVRAAAVIR